MPKPYTPIRVAVLIDYVSEVGGAEVLAVELLRRLDPERFDRRLVTYRYSTPTSDDGSSERRVVPGLRAEGVVVDQLDALSRWDVAGWRPFVRDLRAGHVDILHSHKHGPNMWAGLLARVAPLPVMVAHEHTWSFEGKPVRVAADRWIVASKADVILAVSEEDRRKIIEVERIPADRVRVLQNGIATMPASKNGDLRAEFGIPAASPLVGAVGIFREQKDYPNLVQAHRLVLERRPDAHLVLVGSGETQEQVEGLVDELGLRDRIHFTGFRASGGGLARGLDVAVNSSTFEGSSLAIIEYMAAARPIVATAVGGTSDLLDDGAAGVLVPPQRPDALAQAILELLDDPTRAAALGAAALARQQTRYGIAEQVERLEELYLELHRAKRAAAA